MQLLSESWDGIVVNQIIKDFIKSPDTVLINFKVEKFLLVDNFQNVKVIKI